MQHLIAISNALRTFIASRVFFFVIIAVFTLSALWIALFSLYPMAFDEDFHMGLIRIYATSWLPYGIEHTRDMATYGSATADPSYLWHYLLSFPYRIMEFFGWSERSIVTILRVINVSVVVAALFVYRKVLLEAKLGPAKSNLAIAFFTLIPIFPILAGQVNYDNPLLLLISLSFLLAIRWQKKLTANKQIPVMETYLLGVVILFTAPIKYVYLPIAASIVLWLCLAYVVQRKHLKLRWKKQWNGIIRQIKKIPMRAKIIGILVVAIGSFFSANYLINYATYGSLTPRCGQVFDEEACLNYGPYARDYYLRRDLDPSFAASPLPVYIASEWLPGMAERLTFAVAGPTNDYQTKEPIPAVIDTLVTLTIIGSAATIVMIKRVVKLPLATLTLTVTTIYIGLLIMQLYGSYRSTGEPVAINGRYLLPLLPFIGATYLYAISQAARAFKVKKYLPIIAAACVCFLVLVGGGIGTYILLAEPHWYW